MPFDESEEEPLTEPDTENSTKFHPDEGTPPTNDPGKWDRLSGINKGVVDSFGNASSSARRSQERYVAWDVIAGANHLDLTHHQKTTGRPLMDSIDLEQLGGHIHLGALCVAIIVVRIDTYSSRMYHPRRSDKNNDDLFNDTVQDFGWSDNGVHSYLNRVEDQLSGVLDD